MWVFYVECELGIRVRPLDVRRLKGTRGRGKVVYDYALGPFMFVGPKLIQLGIYYRLKPTGLRLWYCRVSGLKAGYPEVEGGHPGSWEEAQYEERG